MKRRASRNNLQDNKKVETPKKSTPPVVVDNISDQALSESSIKAIQKLAGQLASGKKLLFVTGAGISQISGKYLL